VVVNPENPSGNYIPKADIIRLADWAKEQGIRLLIDESFADFSEEEENTLICQEILDKYADLYVMKSISKSYGVPGLRLGVLASGDLAGIAALKKDVAIWNINSFAEFYMQIFSKYEKDYIIACHKFIEERNIFFKELKDVSFLRVIPSQANYFLCEVGGKYSAKELTEILLKKYRQIYGYML
jgi:histidinol-phosphate/aromatic aminotransferase/cobyric acid decarboxylase-like protein